ncbi:hypothetical protein ACFX12_028288 [Malus domestica]
MVPTSVLNDLARIASSIPVANVNTGTETPSAFHFQMLEWRRLRGNSKATMQGWLKVFSYLVNGETESSSFPKNPVHDLTKKNPSSPTTTFKEGIIPTL